MKNIYIGRISISFLLVFACNFLYAQAVLCGWDMSTQSGFGNSSLNPNVTASSITVGALTKGAGIVNGAGAAARGWGGGPSSLWDITSQASIANGALATFTVESKTGYNLSLNSISVFDYKISGTGPTSLLLQYQINAGAFNDIISYTGLSTAAGGASLNPVDLSGIPALQNVSYGSVITFRIVPFGSSSTGNWYIYDKENSSANDLEIKGKLSPALAYFRSKRSGNWNDIGSWESSPNGTSMWQDATTYPVSGAKGIAIQNGHIITLTQNETASLLHVKNGGTLTNTNTSGGYSLTIDDEGTALHDFVIDGNYILFGTGTVFNSGAAAIVNAGGIVRADDNTGASQSDDFAYSSRVTFKSGALFEWNNADAFETSGVTYFPNSTDADIPVFLVSNVAPVVGGNNPTTFKGRVKINKAFTFTGGGIKNFRNGITGSSALTQSATAGNFHINAVDAILGGTSLQLILNTPLYLDKSTVIPLDSSVVISRNGINNNVSGNIFRIDGMLDITSQAITNTNGSVIVNGVYRTSISGGFSSGGTFSNSSIPSGNILLNLGSTVELYAPVDQGLNSRNDFANIIFSGSGIKTPGGSFNPNGTITIKDNAVFDCTGRNIGNLSTNLTMTDNSRLIVSTTGTNPAMEGTYDLRGGVIEFANNGGTFQSIRTIASEYNNIEVSGNMVRNSNGNINLRPGASFTVMPTGVFTINDDAVMGINGTQTFEIKAGGVLNCGNPLGFWGPIQGLNSSSINNNIENIILQPGSSINYARNGDQTITAIGATGTVPYQNLSISGTGNKTAPPGVLYIAGDFNKTSAATFVHNNGTVSFTGTSVQNYNSDFPYIKFYNLINNNVAGLNVNDDASIYRLLSLANNSKVILNKDITLLSDAMNTASMGKITSGNVIYNSGRFVVERYVNTNTLINGGHSKTWQFLSTPAFGESVFNTWQEKGDINIIGYGTWITDPVFPANGFDGASITSSMKYYDDITDTWIGISGTNIDLENPKGYMLFVRGDRQSRVLNSPPSPTILRTRGKLYSPGAGYEPPVSIVSAGMFQSVGNPYASAIDFTKINITGNIQKAFIVWDPSLSGNYGVGGYQTISATTFYKPVPGGTDYYGAGNVFTNIQSGQAFFVKNFSGTLGSVTFTESCKIDDGNHLVNRGPADNDSGRQFLFADLYTGSGNIADGNATAFDERFSNKIDEDDVIKINNSSVNFGLKTNSNILSVEARPPVSIADTIFYEMNNVSRGKYVLVISAENMENMIDAWLIDNYLKEEKNVDLSDSIAYEFTIDENASSSMHNRFMIVFRASSGPLPLVFVSVKLKEENNKVIISWKIDHEEDIQEYEVEHSNDGIHFKTISTIGAKNNLDNLYNYIDANPVEGDNYYRIIAVSRSGKKTYSGISKINIDGTPSIVLKRNSIVDDRLHIEFTRQVEGNYHITLFNSLGQLLMQSKIKHNGGNNSYQIDVANYIAQGIYNLEVVKPGGERIVLKYSR